MIRFALACVLALLTHGAYAHKASDSFLYWNSDNAGAPGRLDIALLDLVRVVSFDSNGDGELSWGEVESQRRSVVEYLRDNVLLTKDNETCDTQWRVAGLTQHSDGNYLATEFLPRCPGTEAMPDRVEYNLFFDADTLHRALVSFSADGEQTFNVLSPDRRSLSLSRHADVWSVARQFVWEGMVHLWIGYDHLLFLLALVLPAAVRRQNGHWVVEDHMPSAIKDVALIVTAFTAAHSVTLVISALGWISIPIAWVETLIALSVAVAAINIVWPVLGQRRYLIGFGFGLIHGFGFASVLSELTISTSSRIVALASFNVGVELAQVILVVLIVPLIFLARRQWFYQRVVLPAGVFAIASIGILWAWERAPLSLPM